MTDDHVLKAGRTAKRNRRIYDTYLVRIRKDSELSVILKEHRDYGETSVNFLVCQALCSYLGCALPHREYLRYKRVQLLSGR